MWIPLEGYSLGPRVNPTIQSVFDKLPSVDSVWSVEDQRIWLSELAAVLAVVYRKASCGDLTKPEGE